MADLFTRRQTLTLALSALALSAQRAVGQEKQIETLDPLILRPNIEGVDPRYAKYALSGDFITPAAPFSISSGISNVAVFHPRNVTSARLVVFSHGALSSPLTYRELIWQWVSHGFVVLAPQHNDAVIESGPTLRQTEVGKISQWPVAALLEDPTAWNSRVQACKACLDITDLIESSTGIKLNLDRPVIAGHGYGAYIAQLLMGAKVVQSDGTTTSFKDPRFFSGIFMSPQGPGVMGLTEDSWKEISSPCLFLLSENDFDFTGQPYQEKGKAYQLAHPGYKHLGFLEKGSANSFSGQLASTSEKERRLFEVLKAMSTAFLFAYANYDQTAFSDLKSKFFERMSLGTIKEFIR
jgi:Predicted dienelactone hydrolase